jgi:uncharacterized protein YndB with AHSA1/START domain
MKFTIEVVIDQPREKVWEVFDNPANMSKWQPTVKSFELQSGEPGQPGSVSKLVYDENGREVVLTETITSRNYPDEFSGTYEAPSTWNHLTNKFIPLGDKQTKWVMEAEFRFDGLMKLFLPFMKGSLVKRTQEDMQRFKQLAESQ